MTLRLAGAIRFAILFAIVLGTKTALAACPDFATHTESPAGTDPYGVAIGDFNRDSRPDLAVTNGDGFVSILLQNANGTFASPAPYGTGSGSLPQSIITTDLNGDGRLDLVTSDLTNDAVDILLGTGTGTFGTASVVSIGGYPNSPRSVAVGDFNRDGKLDLAVATSETAHIVILIGDGTGGFGAPQPFDTDSVPYFVAAGDFNEDGITDLAAVNFSNVSILIGAGDGTFPSFTTYYPAGFGPTSLAVGDFDGDGKTDLAVATRNSATIMPGDGNGGFGSGTSYAAGATGFTPQIAIGDFNGDGKPDVAITNSESNSTSILIGNGAGGLSAPKTYAVATQGGLKIQSIAAGDLNGDGRADAVIGNYATGNVSILQNSGVCSGACGTLSGAVNYGSGGALSAAAGDFDRDGRPDLAAVLTASNNVAILLQNPNGTFGSATNFGVGSTPFGVAVGDVNRDGKLDLAVVNTNSDNVSILLGDGTGSFNTSGTFAVGDNSVANRPRYAAIGDFNRDGKPDLAVSNALSGFLSILIGNGSGGFSAPTNIAVGNGPRALAIADLNGDGKLDIAVACFGDASMPQVDTGHVSILLGNGAGAFSPASNYSAGTAPEGVAIADFDGDGVLDLAVPNFNSNNVSFLKGNGAGAFFAPANTATGTNSISIATADFNGDGKADLAVANRGSNNVSLLFGNGSGGFASALNSPTGTVPNTVAVADLDTDGKPDLIFATNNGTNNVSVLFDTCPGPDLKITKSHTGDFIQGQTSAEYTITVTNVGATPTSGLVTVTETLPGGLVATSAVGAGWACATGNPITTCTRSDALDSSNYPITLTVDVAADAPANLTNTATVGGGGEFNESNDTASDPTTIGPNPFTAPANVIATATSTSEVTVTWDDVPGAAGYQVFRRSGSGMNALVGSPPGTTFPDSGLTENTAYLYWVRAVGAAANVGPQSSADLATTIVFTDDPVFANTTNVKADHFLELRIAVDAVRATAGLANAVYTHGIATNADVKAVDVTELRTKLDEARSALGLLLFAYTDSGLAPGDPIKAAHVTDLRNGVK